MKFNTPAGQNPIDQSRSWASRPTASTASTRPPARRPTPTSATTWRRTKPTATFSAPASPRGACAGSTPRRQRGRRRPRHRDDPRACPHGAGHDERRLPVRRRRGAALHQAIAVVVARPSSRPGAAFLVEGRLRPAAASSISRRGQGRQAVPGGDSGEGSAGNGEERVGDFEGAFAQRLSSSTRPTLLPTRATR